MTVTSVDKDSTALTMTITADFDAEAKRVWELWADASKLGQWWGPPTYPATFTELDLTPGGRAAYFMTGPEGEQYHGVWSIVDVVEPTRIEIDDLFADDQGQANPEMPVNRMEVTFADRPDGGSRMVIINRYASTEDMDKLLSMGTEEGMREAIGQMDALLV